MTHSQRFAKIKEPDEKSGTFIFAQPHTERTVTRKPTELKITYKINISLWKK